MNRDPRLSEILNDEPCLACQNEYWYRDPHHYPRARGMGGSSLVTFGILEVVPVCRRCHGLAEEGHAWTVSMIERYAGGYYRYQYLRFVDSDVYLGPEYRIAEIREEVNNNVEIRSRSQDWRNVGDTRVPPE